MKSEELSNNAVIREDPRGPFNVHSRFVFLQNCYQQPVAFFPYDPFKSPLRRNNRDDIEVVDLNEEQISSAEGLF